MSNSEHNNFNSNDNACHCTKHAWLIALLAFLGSFLAFYVLMHQTMMHYMAPFKHDMGRLERNMDRDFRREMHKVTAFPEKEFKGFKNKISAIHSAKFEDAYVIVVNLKQFDNNENNIRFNVSGNLVTISGNVNKSKRGGESSYYFTESFEIPEKIKMSEIKKEKYGDKYIITLPIEN